MAKSDKKRASRSTGHDYRQLIRRASLLIGMLEDVQRHTRRMRWWSIRIAEDVTAPNGIEVATNRLANVLKADYEQSLIYLGGIGAVDHKSWQVHAAAGAGVTFDQYREIADACARVVKTLGIPGPNRSTKEVFAGTPGPSSSEPEVFVVIPTDCPPFRTPELRVEDVSEFWCARPEYMYRMLWVRETSGAGMKVSDYLSSLPKRLGDLPRDVPPDVSCCMAVWFSFLWENAEEIGVVTTKGVAESRTWEALLTYDPSEHFLVPYRTIENGICEASILALQFLRQKAVERLELLQGAKEPRAGVLGEKADGQERTREPRPKVPLTEANIEVRRLLKENPSWDWTVRKLATTVGCSTGTVSSCPAWKAYNERRKLARKEGTIKTVSLTSEMEAVLGVDADSLVELTAEQEAEDLDDTRKAKLYLSHKKKREGRES